MLEDFDPAETRELLDAPDFVLTIEGAAAGHASCSTR